MQYHGYKTGEPDLSIPDIFGSSLGLLKSGAYDERSHHL